MGFVAVIAATAWASGPSNLAQAPKPDEPVTIVGCLVQGDPALRGGQRTASGSASEGEYFVRTPAIQVPVGTTVTVGGSGSAAAGTGRPGATTSAGVPDKSTLYLVSGLDREQLRPHLDHRVELQGRLSPADKSSETTSARTTVDANGRPLTQVETRMEIAGVLTATAIKMVSASCK